MKIKDFKNGKKHTKQEIELWEKENNISLHDDYKSFLTNIGTGDVCDFYSDYEINYIKQIAEDDFYDEITGKITYEAIIPHKQEYYSIFYFFNLDELIQENRGLGNYDPNKSSLLIFAGFGNNYLYSICIDKNSNNYGKIYYTKSGYHIYFEYLQEHSEAYQDELPCLENNFNDFIENIELVEEE